MTGAVKNEYQDILDFDELLEKEQPNTKIRSKLFISKSRKRIKDLCDDDYFDKETFNYNDKEVWNGF